MKSFVFYLSLFLILCLFHNTGCGNNQQEENQKQKVQHEEKTEPTSSGPVTLSLEEFEGMKLFMHNCNKCHPGGEKGKGPSLNDKPLPNFLIHWQVRIGAGDMPKFTEEQISKNQLKQITAFVKLMQNMTRE